ncbi:SEC10/PgrA surface exclusion domain-containing protein [Streptococcus halotolerans]|uniref:SEC10/PgrA surface exclusion domain-containing protein n=1 Tax=Streptococcus halotolerans TaxID=1814128 RepID=UPI000789661B|nr:SEC10/PgrA surface exclusion domain-containing protein [Streptococcus halotolerans]
MKNKTLKGTSLVTLALAASGVTTAVHADDAQPTVNPSVETSQVTQSTETTHVTDQQLDGAKQQVATTKAAADQAKDVYEDASQSEGVQQKVVEQATTDVTTAEQASTMTTDQVKAVESEVAHATSELPQAEQSVEQAQQSVDKAQSAADQPVAPIVDQEAVDTAQAEVATKSEDVKTAQAELDQTSAKLKSAESEASDAKTLLERVGSDERSVYKTDFDFKEKYGITASQFWSSIGGQSNVLAKDAKKSDLSEQNNLYGDVSQFTIDRFSRLYGTDIDEADQNWELDVNNLTDFELRTLTNYAANMINGLRRALQEQLRKEGSDIVMPLVQFTEESLASARKYNEWLVKHYPAGFKGHVMREARKSPELKGTLIENTVGESIGNGQLWRDRPTTMAKLKDILTDQIGQMAFEDYFANHGHTSMILATDAASYGNTGVETWTFTPVRFEDGAFKFLFNMRENADPKLKEPKKLATVSDEELAKAKAAVQAVTNLEKGVKAATDKLTSAKSALSSAEQKLATAKKGDAAAAKAETLKRLDALETAKNKLVEAQDKVKALKAVIADGNAKLKAHNSGVQSLADAKSKLAKAEKDLANAKAKTASAKVAYDKALVTYQDAKSEYAKLLAARDAEQAVQDTTKPIDKPTDVEQPGETDEPVVTDDEENVKPIIQIDPETGLPLIDNTPQDVKPDTVKPTDAKTDIEQSTKADPSHLPIDLETGKPIIDKTPSEYQPTGNAQNSGISAHKTKLDKKDDDSYNKQTPLRTGITQNNDGSLSYSRVAANNTLPSTGERHSNNPLIGGLLLLSGLFFYKKRKSKI